MWISDQNTKDDNKWIKTGIMRLLECGLVLYRIATIEESTVKEIINKIIKEIIPGAHSLDELVRIRNNMVFKLIIIAGFIIIISPFEVSDRVSNLVNVYFIICLLLGLMYIISILLIQLKINEYDSFKDI